jgi:hypothetical protein
MLLLAILLPIVQAAYFDCEIRTSCLANETLLVRLNSSEPSTPNNSHAQLANYTGNAYPYEVCCSTDAFRTLSNSCAASEPTTILKLFAATDSHVQAGSQSGYSWNACLNVTSGNITCEYPNDACTSGYSGIVSISSSEAADNNLTNAHVADFNLYKRKVCCQVGAQNPPVVASASISPEPTATTRDDLSCLNGAVSDPDGDDVTLHYNWYRNGTSITVLNLPMDYDSSAGVTHDISGFGNHGTVSNSAGFVPTDCADGGCFSGNSDNQIITMPESPLWNFSTDDFTLSAWLNATPTMSEDIIDYENASGAGFAMVVSTNTIRCRISDGATIVQTSALGTAFAGTWHHFVCKRNSTSLVLYKDGTVLKSVSTNGINVSTAATLTVRVQFSANNLIDELLIFNRSLSAAEVATLYRSYNQQLNSTELRRADLWNCSITPVDSTGLNGSTKYSSQTTISGSPPLDVSLLYPANNNQSVFERYVNFSWSTADERDGDAVTYSLNLTVTPGTCSVQTQLTGLSTTNRTYGELCTDQTYNWTVRACDTDGCSSWATKYNFTIASVLSIVLRNNNTDFGTLNPEDSKDTQYGGVAPFRIENDGNVMANITVNASNSPFTLAALGSTAFQFKARQNETNAYNTTGSQATYTPMDAILKNVLKQLNYSDASDTAYVDINITVPDSEPPGTKSTDVLFRAEMSS